MASFAVKTFNGFLASISITLSHSAYSHSLNNITFGMIRKELMYSNSVNRSQLTQGKNDLNFTL